MRKYQPKTKIKKKILTVSFLGSGYLIFALLEAGKNLCYSFLNAYFEEFVFLSKTKVMLNIALNPLWTSFGYTKTGSRGRRLAGQKLMTLLYLYGLNKVGKRDIKHF